MTTPDELLPVTQADIDVTNAILGSPTMRGAVQLAARHRQSSSNAGGVDEAKKRTAINGILAGLLLPLVADPKELIALGNQACTEILASLSTPTAEPMGERVCSACDGESKGCTGEYRCLRCEGTGVEPDFVDGLDNRPKADDAAVARAARAALGDWLAWPDAARDGAVPVHNEQTISWLQGLPAKLTTPPTPDRIGKDAVREAEAWLRAISVWLLTNDHDMTLPSGILDKDPLDIADSLAAISATPAQPVDETERLRAHIAEQIEHVEQRIKDGVEMGATIWRIALEDVARENRAALQHKGEVSRG